MIPWPTMLAAVEPTTERTLVFLGGGEPWLQVAVWALGALVVGLTVFNHRRLQPMRRRAVMVGLRALLVLLLVLVFYEPAFLEEKVAVHKNTVAVLVDQSESMGLPHGDTTRVALVRELLDRERSTLEGLREQHDLTFFSVGPELREMDDLAAAGVALDQAVTATEPATHLVGALEALKERMRNSDVGGVVLITDGIDTSLHGARVGLGQDVQSVLRDLQAPIISFTTAGDPGIKDLAVTHLAYNNFAFLLNATSLEATIEAHGYAAGEVLTVRLTENGQRVSEQQLTVAPDQAIYRLTFDFVPKTLGKMVYGVEVAPRPDEIYSKNNLQQVIISVVRDKIRVVQIVGQPSWDERYLRNHLKENPNVDLVSFFILVNRFNYRPLSSRETSLIPFPARELFEEELGGFDLLVFQNFNYGPFQTRQYLPYIRQFVLDGGAFLMVGGPLSMSAGGYYGTPITDVLPVDIPPAFSGEETIVDGVFRPALSPGGERHPITRLALEPGANRGLWETMEPLEGVNAVTRAHEDAVVLLEHPSAVGQDGAPHPVAAVREVGKGRTMVMATDSTWHWAFRAGAHGKDPQNYETFWSNAIRWLIKDPELDLVKVKVLRENVPVGQQAEALVQVFQPDYRPAANQAVTVVARRRGPGDAQGGGEEVVRLDAARTNADGELTVTVPISERGIYEVEAKAAVVAGRLATGVDLFVGTEENPELAKVVGDDRLLTQLAEASGGAVYDLNAPLADLPFEQPEVIRVQSRQHRELWSGPWPLVLIAVLFGLEWWLRRRYGYL